VATGAVRSEFRTAVRLAVWERVSATGTDPVLPRNTTKGSAK